MTCNGKMFVYLVIAIISFLCFIYGIINMKNTFIPSLEFYTTIGCFLFYIHAFYLELTNKKFTQNQSHSNCFLYVLRFILSYKFLFTILLASFLKFIILEVLLQESQIFNLPALTAITILTTKVLLPIFNIFNLIYNINRTRMTNAYDLTAMLIIFLIFGIINLILELCVFNTNNPFIKTLKKSIGEALLCLIFAISGIPLHDYFLNYKSEAHLLN